jgi:hypothetical protein
MGEKKREGAAFGGALRRFDMYGKVYDEHKVNTNSGGVISVATLVLLVVLFVHELNLFVTVEFKDHILVDTSLNQKLPISLNITFPHLRCDEVSVDTVDSAGENQIDVHGTLTRFNLNVAGDVRSIFWEDDAAVNFKEPEVQGCLSCMAAQEEDLCCNTCGELKQAYRQKGLNYHEVTDTAPQCRDTVGCRISGDVLVGKVGGNIHVALGKSTIRDGKHVHEFNLKDVSDGFNTSHVIHKVRFGAHVPGVQSALEGTSRIVKSGSGMFHYYVKLVPMLYQSREGTVYTNLYSVTDSAKNVMVHKGLLTGLPGFFLVYDFNPFMVKRVEQVVPFSHFLTSLCGIVGGVVTLAGLIDGIGYSTAKTIMKKQAVPCEQFTPNVAG